MNGSVWPYTICEVGPPRSSRRRNEPFLVGLVVTLREYVRGTGSRASLGPDETAAGAHFLLDTGTLCVLSYYRDTPAIKVWNAPVVA